MKKCGSFWMKGLVVPRKLLDSILLDIKNVKPCSDDNPKAIVDFIKIVEKANRDVKILKFVSHLNNNVVVGEIEGKLSVNMNNEWVKLCGRFSFLTI